MRLDSGLSLKIGSWFARAVAAGSTLLDGLVAYWPLDEVSGTRADAVGDNDLTDNNTVGYDTGKNGNAAKFVDANNEYLSVEASDPFAAAGGSISFWVWYTAADLVEIFSTTEQLVNDWDHFRISIAASPAKLSARIRNAAWGALVTVTDAEAMTTNAWHHYVVTWDKAGARITIYRDGAQSATDTYVGDPVVTDDNWMISSPTYGMDGLIDEVGIWSRVLTSDERAELYASGAGVYYNGSDFV